MSPCLATRIPVLLFVLSTGTPALAQNYPVRPIRLVTSAVGGSSDFAARLIAPGLAGGLSQQVIVDNRSGAVLPIEIVAKAPSDGYTLLYFGSTLWILPLLQSNLTYDAMRDFTPVSIAVNSPVIVAVHPTLPVKSIKELIQLAKSKPGALNYGSGSMASPAGLAAELFKAQAGIDMVRVPYGGTGPALNALMAGEVQMLMPSSGGLAGPISAGKIRAIAVTGGKRSAAFPNLPTVSESGLPGYEYGQLSGVFAPARTPASIIDRLSNETARAVSRPDIKEKLFNAGADAEGSTARDAASRIKSEIARLGKIIKEASIRGD